MALALGLAVRMSSSADGKAGDTLKALLAASRPLEELLAARRRDGREADVRGDPRPVVLAQPLELIVGHDEDPLWHPHESLAEDGAANLLLAQQRVHYHRAHAGAVDARGIRRR